MAAKRRYQRGERVIVLFGSTSADGYVLGPSANGKDTYLVHLDEVPDRDYVMARDELTTIEELFG